MHFIRWPIRRRLPGWSALLLLTGLAALGCGPLVPGLTQEMNLSLEALSGSVHAPEFPAGLDWLNTQRPLTLRQLRGKFVLLDFWTFCCINCMHILPDLRRLEEKYASELVVIGVHSAKFPNERESSQIRQAILRYGIRHPVVNDSNLQVWSAYAVRAWPNLVLIDPLGKIMARSSGEGVFEPYDALLQRAIPFFQARGQLKPGRLHLELEEARRPNTLLEFPGKVSADEASRRLVVTDSNHNGILVLSPEGRILDVIGSGQTGSSDGPFEHASFNHPQGTALVGHRLYIADTENHLIRVADLKERTVTTVLGTGAQARAFNRPGHGRSVALNSPWDPVVLGNQLFIAMAGFHQIWVASLQTWEARPFAGSGREDLLDGPMLRAALAQPSGLATDGASLFVADSESSSIRQVLLPAGPVTTLVGRGLFEFGDVDGPRNVARLQHPLGICWRGGLLYLADTYNSKIKVLDPRTGFVRTLAGSGKKGLVDGAASRAAFDEPGGLAWLAGKLYIADTNNHAIRVYDPATDTVSTLSLSGTERLAFRPAPSQRGRLVDLRPAGVRPGSLTVRVTFDVPSGFKLAPEAPSLVRWRLTPASAADPAPFRELKVDPAVAPLCISIGQVEPPAMLELEAAVHYCRSDKTLCYVDLIYARQGLVPASSSDSVLNLRLPVRRPQPEP